MKRMPYFTNCPPLTRAQDLSLSCATLFFILICLTAGAVQAQNTTFAYQGSLNDGGSPANGPYDLQFKLFDALSGGTQLSVTNTLQNVTVTNGIFSVALDFGAVFPGVNRFLEIGVRPGPSTDAFTILTPRQPILSTPYTIRSLSAATSDGLSATCVNCVTSGQIGSLPAGNGNYIQNTNSPQASSNFNISGNGTVAGVLSAGAGVSGSSPNSIGVVGTHTAATGTAPGVQGETNSTALSSVGVLGRVNSTTPGGLSAGVRGISNGTGPFGIGVWGSQAGSGWGVYGTAVAGVGVYGQSNTGLGVWGENTNTVRVGDKPGVYGKGNAEDGGQFISVSGKGVFVQGTTGADAAGVNTGVFASASGDGGRGVWGRADGPPSVCGPGCLQGSTGVFGTSRNPDGIGVQGGFAKGVAPTSGTGVRGESTTGVGVEGSAFSPSGIGVRAVGSGTTGTALEISNGAIKVRNAGIGTNTAVFIHLATVANSILNRTTIDHPLTNGDPNAILIVTSNYSPGGVSGRSYDTVGVRYDTFDNKWAILANNGGFNSLVGATFNVLIIKP